MNTALPPILREIQAVVQRSQQIQPNIKALEPAWRAYLHDLPELPGLVIQAGGETVCLGELSPGCQACKDGSWDCVFLTHQCNLACAFCYNPQSIAQEAAGSAFGATPEAILANYQHTYITGVGFTGGEPFLQPEKLFAWLTAFKTAAPERYHWVYTNGLLVTEAHLQRLAELGLDEIRFNLAASGYDHPGVLETVRIASRTLPRVTVEIPAIPEHASRLLDSLEVWSAAGVQHLNLHELIYEPGTNAASLPGERQVLVTEDGHRTEYNPLSRKLTARVIKRVWELGLPLAVNDCSMQSKLRQVRGRRRSLAPLTRQIHEHLVAGPCFESCFVALNPQEGWFFHPDAFTDISQRHPQARIFRLLRRLPLSLGQPAEWVVCDQIQDAQDLP